MLMFRLQARIDSRFRGNDGSCNPIPTHAENTHRKQPLTPFHRLPYALVQKIEYHQRL